MTEMRESEALDWTKIVDGSRAVKRAKRWNDPSAIIQAAVNAVSSQQLAGSGDHRRSVVGKEHR